VKYSESCQSCPYCGGQLIWNYASGEVVCSSCGAVVEKIYDYSPPLPVENEELWREIRIKRNPKKNRFLLKYRRDYKLYREAVSYLRDKPWLEIDYDKYFVTGRLVNTIKSRATINAEKMISENGLWDIVERGLKIVESLNPAVLARSARGKYALAYMVARYLESRSLPHLDEVTKIFNISETSYRRMVKLIKNHLIPFLPSP